jgi:hypothetical protein
MELLANLATALVMAAQRQDLTLAALVLIITTWSHLAASLLTLLATVRNIKMETLVTPVKVPAMAVLRRVLQHVKTARVVIA